MITELNDRSREIFRQIVDTYLETGEAVGSRTIARRLSMVLSPATVRNVMADLEDLGLLFAPHTSAGRMPTEQGLRMFVDGILEVGNLSEDERHCIESQCAGSANTMEGLLEDATTALSGLSRCTGLVFAPKTHARGVDRIPLHDLDDLPILFVDVGCRFFPGLHVVEHIAGQNDDRF